MSKCKIKFKLNGGNPVILCSHCSTILKYYRHFSDEEVKAWENNIKLPAQYCDKCEEKFNKNF